MRHGNSACRIFSPTFLSLIFINSVIPL
uniref:Uncharacterized protein n=1 Tax=Arundo donax TaxID=35708 RepID=A0A0A9A9T8_ARUDO